MMSFSNEVKLLAGYLNVDNDKRNISYSRSLLSKKLNWQKVLTLARQNDISTLFYHNLQKSGVEDLIPSKIKQEFEKSYFGINLQNICYFEELKRILLLFNNSGIEVILLKGMALTNKIYGNAALRPMADLDILVRNQDVDLVEKLLTISGYKIDQSWHQNEWYRENLHHLAPFYSPNGIYIEIHYDLIPPQMGIHLEIDKVWQRAKIERMDRIDTKILCTEDMLIHLCLHLYGITCVGKIKHLVDIAQLLRYVKDDIDWDMIEKEASKNHFIDYIYYSLYFARRLLSAKIDEQILNRFKRKSSKNFFVDYFLKRVIADNIIYDDSFCLFPKHYHSKIFTLLIMNDPLQEKIKSCFVSILKKKNALHHSDSNSLISRISKSFNYIFTMFRHSNKTNN